MTTKRIDFVSLTDRGQDRGNGDESFGSYEVRVEGLADTLTARDIPRLTAEQRAGWRRLAYEPDGQRLSLGLARNEYMVAAVLMIDEAEVALEGLLRAVEAPVRMGLVHVCFACDETQPEGYEETGPTVAHRPHCPVVAARELLARDAPAAVTEVRVLPG